jgi:hypothetical protein
MSRTFRAARAGRPLRDCLSAVSGQNVHLIAETCRSALLPRGLNEPILIPHRRLDIRSAVNTCAGPPTQGKSRRISLSSPRYRTDDANETSSPGCLDPSDRGPNPQHTGGLWQRPITAEHFPNAVRPLQPQRQHDSPCEFQMRKRTGDIVEMGNCVRPRLQT